MSFLTRLWHQLTGSLVEFYQDPKSNGLRLRLYNRFIATFHKKINQLKLVQFALGSLPECRDDEEKLAFLKRVEDTVSPDQEALIFAQVEIARIYLHLKTDDTARGILDTVGKQIEKLDSVDTIINGAYYSVNSEYYKHKEDFNNYYTNSLLYLACITVTEHPLLDQQKRAYDLSIAALLGDKIYNFGELLVHPILASLVDTEYSWLRDLLFALNTGDINSFESLSGNFSKQPVLQNEQAFLQQKICLTALIELVFSRPSTSRILTFEEIGKHTHLTVDEVEHLVMRALSLGLIKGFIDQVSETVTVTWIQPRVMNEQQITSMKDKLLAWDDNVKKLAVWMQDNGKEIWTSA